jgi:hypothetical protein
MNAWLKAFWPANSGLSVLDWWLCSASLRSPFSNFRFGIPETGSICDGDRFAELRFSVFQTEFFEVDLVSLPHAKVF